MIVDMVMDMMAVIKMDMMIDQSRIESEEDALVSLGMVLVVIMRDMMMDKIMVMMNLMDTVTISNI